MDTAQLLKKLESYGFTCEAGDLQQCLDWKALKAALLERGEAAREGFVLVPRELTAENGMKGALSGEFDFSPFNDDMGYPINVTVPWDTIKEIHRKVVEICSTSAREGS